MQRNAGNKPMENKRKKYIITTVRNYHYCTYKPGTLYVKNTHTCVCDPAKTQPSTRRDEPNDKTSQKNRPGRPVARSPHRSMLTSSPSRYLHACENRRKRTITQDLSGRMSEADFSSKATGACKRRAVMRLWKHLEFFFVVAKAPL